MQMQMHMMTIPELLEKAARMGASDLHIVVGLSPTVRVDGGVVRLPGPPVLPQDAERLLWPLLSESRMERLMSERNVEFSIFGDYGRCRASVFFERGCPGAAFRLIPEEVPTSQELGLPPVMSNLAMRPNGLVLITGPAGVGKSTTLSWMVDHINQQKPWRIITIEDPIEFLHRPVQSSILQRQVGGDCTGFYEALIQALRQDPDVICLGEMRDLETISTALVAAETGHLVLSTLHTTSAASAIDRIIDAFPPHHQHQVRSQLAGALQGVVAQTLVPRATGQGRVLACEVMLASPAMRNLIREGRTPLLYNLIATGSNAGMQTMEQSLADLCRRGEITEEAALSHVNDAEVLSGLLEDGVFNQRCFP